MPKGKAKGPDKEGVKNCTLVVTVNAGEATITRYRNRDDYSGTRYFHVPDHVVHYLTDAVMADAPAAFRKVIRKSVSTAIRSKVRGAEEGVPVVISLDPDTFDPNEVDADEDTEEVTNDLQAAE